MIDLRIVMNADGAFPELEGSDQIELHAVGLLSGGMQSGRSAVVFVLKSSDGKKVYFSQTSLRMFMAAASAFHHVWHEEETPPQGVVQ